MKPFHYLVVSGLCLTQIGYAQQTYFNVPSSDVVSQHEVAVQQQFSFSESFRSSTTVNYGLGREWEIGLNFYNLNYQPGERRISINDSTTEKSFNPLLMLNAQKAFDITDNLEVAIGAQAGMNVLTKRSPQVVGYVYGNIAGFSNDEHYNVSAGSYAGNARYLGDGPKIGFQAGFDAGIFYKKLHLLGDWVSGSHNFGQLTLGLEVFLGKHFPLAIGWQRMNKDGEQALIIQLTFNPE